MDNTMDLIEAAVLFIAAMGVYSFSIIAIHRLADLRGRSRRKWSAKGQERAFNRVAK